MLGEVEDSLGRMEYIHGGGGEYSSKTMSNNERCNEEVKIQKKVSRTPWAGSHLS